MISASVDELRSAVGVLELPPPPPSVVSSFITIFDCELVLLWYCEQENLVLCKFPSNKSEIRHESLLEFDCSMHLKIIVRGHKFE